LWGRNLSKFRLRGCNGMFWCVYILQLWFFQCSFILFLHTDPSLLEGVCRSDQAQSASSCLWDSVAILFLFIYIVSLYCSCVLCTLVTCNRRLWSHRHLLAEAPTST
jgi:hypothetical protein